MALKTTGNGSPFGSLTTNQSGLYGTGTGAFAALQPYSSIDLSKVVETTGGRSTNRTYGIPVQVNTSRGMVTQYQDITPYVKGLQKFTGTLGVKDSQDRSMYGSEGNLSLDASLGKYSGLSDGNINVSQPKLPNNQYLIDAGQRFATDKPGYFQVGEDPYNRGNYDRGKLDTNNIAGMDDAKVNSLVQYDPKYGYIAPDELRKRSRDDFLNKYGVYVVLAVAGGALAAGALAGGGAAAGSAGGAAGGSAGGAGAGAGAGGTFSGIGAAGGASAGTATGTGTFYGLGAAGSTGAATGSTVAGGIGAGAGAGGLSTAGSAAAAGFGIPAGGYAGAAIGANGAYGATGGLNSGAAAAGNSAGTAQQVGNAAPISQGTPTSVGLNPGSANPGLLSETGKLGSAVLGGGGSGGGLLSQGASALGGGGGGGWFSTLLGAGLSAYQAREMADALEVQDKSTDYSRTSGGHTSFDTSIRQLQDESLANTKAQETGVMGYGSVFKARSDEDRGAYDRLYAELTSNQNPYAKARLDPVRERIASGRGQIQRNQGLRGVSGSSFGNDELTNFDFAGTRELGNAGALATQESLGARSGVLGNMANLNTSTLAGNTQLTNTMNTLNSNRTGIARDRANLERAGLGLSADSANAAQMSEIQKQEMYGQMLQRLLGGTQ